MRPFFGCRHGRNILASFFDILLVCPDRNTSGILDSDWIGFGSDRRGMVPGRAVVRPARNTTIATAAAAAPPRTKRPAPRTKGLLALCAALAASTPAAATTTNSRALAFATAKGFPKDQTQRRDPSTVGFPAAAGRTRRAGTGCGTTGSATSASATPPMPPGSEGTGRDAPTAFSVATSRLESPSAERNKDPIWGVLSSRILRRGNEGNHPWTVLEVAAGAGVHTECFASRWLSSLEHDADKASSEGGDSPPPFVWHATDPEDASLASVRSRVASSPGLEKVVAPPELLTLGEGGIEASSLVPSFLSRGDEPLDLVLCINMIHISPWGATLGLMKLAGERLRLRGGCLYCYGPYRHEGRTVLSNENFDRSLKSRNPEWGVRDLNDVIDAARKEGLELVECIDMPSNNNSLIFRRQRA